VGAEHDAAFDLGAEALAAALADHVEQVAELRRPMAEVDAVVASQVARCFCRGHQIVSCHRVRTVRQRLPSSMRAPSFS